MYLVLIIEDNLYPKMIQTAKNAIAALAGMESKAKEGKTFDKRGLNWSAKVAMEKGEISVSPAIAEFFDMEKRSEELLSLIVEREKVIEDQMKGNSKAVKAVIGDVISKPNPEKTNKKS